MFVNPVHAQIQATILTQFSKILQAESPLLNNSSGNQLQAPSINYQCRPPPNPSLVVTTDSDHQVSEKRKLEKFESEDKMEKIDIIGHITGKFGRWQLRTVLLIYLTKIPSSWFMACIIFTAPAARHGEFFCKPTASVVSHMPNQTTNYEHLVKQNKEDFITISHPYKEEKADEEFVIDFCNVYADAENHARIYFHNHTHEHPWVKPQRNASTIIPCDSFIHHSEYKSIITDYDLVCSRDILVATTQFFHLFGVLTGGLLAYNLLKFISPKRVMVS